MSVTEATSTATGRIVWITGLSGAGKSTIGHAVTAMLREQGEPVVLLDGDAVRQAIADPHVGHDRDSRLANAYRISRIAAMLAAQGTTVIVATMSLFHEIHAFNRSHGLPYCEVLVSVEPAALRARDARGLYSRAARGEVANVVGHDLAPELPLHPDLVLRNDPPLQDPRELATAVLRSATANAATASLGQG